MNIKYSNFLKNAQELNHKFGIVPLLYGSLGLEVLTSTSLNSDDIDILIPGSYIKGEKWLLLKQFLTENGYYLIDEKEHTFRKDTIDYSYASIENLQDFAGINLEDIELYTDSNVNYLLLSIEQYLKVYQKSSQDGYRINKKEKQDFLKIQFINNEIEKRKKPL